MNVELMIERWLNMARLRTTEATEIREKVGNIQSARMLENSAYAYRRCAAELLAAQKNDIPAVGAVFLQAVKLQEKDERFH